MKKKLTAKQKFGKPRVFAISTTPYRQDCVVVVNGKIEDAIKFLKKQKTSNGSLVVKAIEDSLEDMTEAIPKKDNGVLFTELPFGYLMMFNHGESWIKTTALVAHESLHLTHYVLRRAGLNLTESSEEAYTYLLQDIMEQILKEIY